MNRGWVWGWGHGQPTGGRLHMFLVMFLGPSVVESYCGGRHPSKARVSEEPIGTLGAGRKLKEM